MNVVQPLIELQEVDGRIRELEREAKDIPRRKALESARLAGVNAALEIAKNHVEALRRRVNEDEAEAEQIREKVRGLKTAQLNIKSNKEMQQSIIQIESLEHEAEAAENRALALQGDEMPTLEARVRDAQAKVDAEQGGVDGFLAELDNRLAEVKAELETFRRRRQGRTAHVALLRAHPHEALAGGRAPERRRRVRRMPSRAAAQRGADGAAQPGACRLHDVRPHPLPRSLTFSVMCACDRSRPQG